MELNAASCYRALQARDARFDGVFYVGVTTTGIYCRPICRARTPRPDRCEYFVRSADAERRGYRACFLCRPEVAPGIGADPTCSPLVATAVARIDAGALNDASVEALAAELGVTGRHLRRALSRELGLTPVALAQSRRLALVKHLVQDSGAGLADVAFAAGFASVRRMNAAFRARFGRPPGSLRREHGAAPAGDSLVLRLDGREPFAWPALLAFFAARATPGVEEVADGCYRRSVEIGAARGWLSIRLAGAAPAVLRVEVAAGLAPALMAIAARVRRLFDLDAHPLEIDSCLAQDPALAASVAARPGLRVPGAFDGFESAVRTILGQQVSVRAATTLAGRLAARFGAELATPYPSLVRVPPSAARLADAGPERLAAVGLPAARARTLHALACAVAGGELVLEAGQPPAPVMERLLAIPGVGPWTAEVVAMRALGWPDAFPAGDLAIRRALGSSARAATARAERWRPWRAYGVQHVWSQLAASQGAGG